MPFSLSKWYFDCIGTKGDVFIGYAGQAQYQRFSLSYSSSLFRGRGGDYTTAQSLRPIREPVYADHSWKWIPDELGVSGVWQPSASGISAVVAEGVHWDCAVPRASTCVHLDRGRAFSGLGYLEHLSMTIEPWRLPIRSLRWGRFLHPQAVVIWIDWSGSESHRFVFRDGFKVDAEIPNDRQIILPDGQLHFDCGVTLRSGSLGHTVFGRAQSALSWLPSKLLRVRETKWLSHCRMQQKGGANLEGWAIHEVVHWK